MKKILLLGSPHGNEILGDKLYAYITKKHTHLLSYTDFVIGNPRAKAQNVRFIESDLNRSFNGKNLTYEERRATFLVKMITDGRYDLVLDLHTATCAQPPCLITQSVQHPFIRASSITNVVHMKHSIVKTSLIGVCATAISVEVRESEVDEKVLEGLCGDIRRFIERIDATDTKQVFEITGLLRKAEISEDDATKLRNFKKSRHGFYPVLVGENSYKKHTEYLGFKARTPYTIRYNRR